MKSRNLFSVFTIFIFLTAGLAAFLNFEVFAVDQIKSAEFFVISSDVQISSATSSQFSIYIGDNLAGVSNPVKSVYFVVSGVYTSTAAGSIELKIDNDSATSKTFTFPNVGTTPTAFEIIYKDDSNKINPTSAGAYSYTLNIAPANITVSGLGAKINVTHRYAPPTCPDGQPSNEKIKTTDFFVIGSESQISSATSSQFTIYIGDNLAGVSNPVKSAYFTVSGVYTGNGTIELKIDNDSGTAKTFTLPNVGTTPTPFEIIYKDDSNKINPTSAGSYSYTFNIAPANITISGLGAKVSVSHRYKPPACGGYPATGDLTSMVFDTGTEGAAYNSIMWKGNLGGPSQNQGKVRFQLATSDSSSGPFNFIGGSTCSSGDWFEPVSPYADTPVELKCYSQFNNKRYFKYKVQICSGDCSAGGSYTPQVDDAVVSWSP